MVVDLYSHADIEGTHLVTIVSCSTSFLFQRAARFSSNALFYIVQTEPFRKRMHAFVEGTNKMEWEMDGIKGPDGMNKVEKGGKLHFTPFQHLDLLSFLNNPLKADKPPLGIRGGLQWECRTSTAFQRGGSARQTALYICPGGRKRSSNQVKTYV